MDQERADQSRKVESTGGDKQSSGGATSTSKLDTKGEAEPPSLSTAPGAADGASQGGAVSSSRDLARKTPPPASASTEPPLAVSDARGAASSPVAAPSSKITMESVRDVLGKFGKKVVEATKQAEDLAGNVWQHLKTGPSIADAAMGRIAQGTKVIAEGGYERIFRQTFDTLPEEQLKNSFACYLSTSAGPVMGILYLSSAKLSFCSDTPLSYKVGDQTEWSYYKVVIPLHQLRQINPSASKANRAEKYIQIISVDNHEFWFLGFVNYDSAVMCLQEALDGSRNEN